MKLKELEVTDIPKIVPYLYDGLEHVFPMRTDDEDYYHRLLCHFIKHRKSYVVFDSEVFCGMLLTTVKKSLWNPEVRILSVASIATSVDNTSPKTIKILMDQLMTLVDELMLTDRVQIVTVDSIPGVTNINYEKRGFTLKQNVYVMES